MNPFALRASVLRREIGGGGGGGAAPRRILCAQTFVEPRVALSLFFRLLERSMIDSVRRERVRPSPFEQPSTPMARCGSCCAPTTSSFSTCQGLRTSRSIGAPTSATSAHHASMLASAGRREGARLPAPPSRARGTARAPAAARISRTDAPFTTTRRSLRGSHRDSLRCAAFLSRLLMRRCYAADSLRVDVGSC